MAPRPKPGSTGGHRHPASGDGRPESRGLVAGDVARSAGDGQRAGRGRDRVSTNDGAVDPVDDDRLGLRLAVDDHGLRRRLAIGDRRLLDGRVLLVRSGHPQTFRVSAVSSSAPSVALSGGHVGSRVAASRTTTSSTITEMLSRPPLCFARATSAWAGRIRTAVHGEHRAGCSRRRPPSAGRRSRPSSRSPLTTGSSQLSAMLSAAPIARVMTLRSGKVLRSSRRSFAAFDELLAERSGRR